MCACGRSVCTTTLGLRGSETSTAVKFFGALSCASQRMRRPSRAIWIDMPSPMPPKPSSRWCAISLKFQVRGPPLLFGKCAAAVALFFGADFLAVACRAGLPTFLAARLPAFLATFLAAFFATLRLAAFIPLSLPAMAMPTSSAFPRHRRDIERSRKAGAGAGLMVVRYFGKRIRGIRWRALISTEIGFYRALGGAAIDARRGNESFTLFGVREPGSMTLPPGIQLLGLGLLGAFETIVGLDEE